VASVHHGKQLNCTPVKGEAGPGEFERIDKGDHLPPFNGDRDGLDIAP
jgi:hypothetical protein